jgi:isopenicillin N synthase-like dioxygenase
LAGKPGALEATAGELCHTCQAVGFYFIRGHCIPWNIVDEAFEASRLFQALPLEKNQTQGESAQCRVHAVEDQHFTGFKNL